MKKTLLLISVVILLATVSQFNPTLLSSVSNSVTYNNDAVESAFERRVSDVQVRGSGEVIKLLADDNEGTRHQKFIVRITSDQTVLISHNIDLAPRIKNLSVGDVIEFYGEYEWNARGGVVHWTHHDPRGKHVGGWLKHKGKTYQ